MFMTEKSEKWAFATSTFKLRHQSKNLMGKLQDSMITQENMRSNIWSKHIVRTENEQE